MIETVEQFLIKYNLASTDKTFLVGFSGGCDSLCLLDILKDMQKKYQFRLIALHLNHNWRGEEAKQEEINCKNFCERQKIEFIAETLDGNGPKTEKYAREARYDFFLKYARKYENSVIFTAHTRTDNAETLIYRIAKGTGIKGLQGILPETKREEIPLYRPILELSREETQKYCIAKGLIANVDSSNLDINYKRNFIRQKIMPLFKELNYNYEKSIVSLAKLAINQNKIADEYINSIRKDIYDDNKILTSKFKQLSSEIMQKIIYDVCLRENWDYDYKKVLNILEFIKKNFNSKAGSRYSVSKNLWIFANEKYIQLISNGNKHPEISPLKILSEGEYNIPNSNIVFSIQKFSAESPAAFPKETDFTAYISLENFNNLVIRNRLPGDIISPFGMSGSMKLKKYLNSKGVMQHEKDTLVLLCKDKEVLWVAGVGLSNKLKVVNSPTHVIKLKHKTN